MKQEINQRSIFFMGKLFGLTGGIGTGKSTVCHLFRKKGAAVFNMDETAREIVLPGKDAYNSIVEWLGQDILLSDQTLNRKKIADIVFNNPDKRKKLESITHPLIIKESMQQIQKADQQGFPVIIIEIPLLFETGLQSLFKPIILVISADPIRIDRIKKRDQASEAEVLQRMKAQIPQEDKIKMADYIINNNGDLNDLETQVDCLWNEMIKQG